jgi:hypothetical protein
MEENISLGQPPSVTEINVRGRFDRSHWIGLQSARINKLHYTTGEVQCANTGKKVILTLQ